MAREIFPNILLDKLNTEVRIVDAFDLVTDTTDCFPRLASGDTMDAKKGVGLTKFVGLP